MVRAAAPKARRTKPSEAQRQAPVGTPKAAVERDRDAFINATIQDLVNQTFLTTNYLIFLVNFWALRTLFAGEMPKS
jgi:hypothetical protein